MKAILVMMSLLFSCTIFADCSISFLNEVSARRGALLIHKKMKEQRKILRSKGFKYAPYMGPVPGDYLLEVFYVGSARKKLRAQLSNLEGEVTVKSVKVTTLTRSVQDLFRKLPSCKH